MYKEMLLGKNRVEALTDGIYAIAMTLGVLTIKFPIFQEFLKEVIC